MRPIMNWFKHIRPKRLALVAGGVVLLFGLINLGVYLRYQHRTYPGTYVGSQQLGSSVPSGDFAAQVGKLKLLPSTVKVSYNGVTTPVKPTVLGISIDTAQLQQAADAGRSWLPVANLFGVRHIPVALKVNSKAYAQGFSALQTAYYKAAVDAQLALQDGAFSIKPEATGFTLDKSTVQHALLRALSQGKTALQLPAKQLLPKVTTASLTAELDKLQNQQKTSVTFTYNGKSKTPSTQEIGAWFAAKDTSFALADGNIQSFITGVGSGFGIRVQNIAQAIAAAKDAVSQGKPLNFALVAMPAAVKTYSYCTAVKGVDASNLPGLLTKLSATYADGRSWSLNGKVAFTYVDSGCNFTVWLTAANQMSTFGDICDAEWSCRVGDNVVINFDRWQGASPSWNNAGGSLDEYRSMVINHETGHWFGFYHAFCGGAGQAAPVMQQQSIDLQGCTFNAWPLASEQAALKASLGI